jgi:hypothetical protein
VWNGDSTLVDLPQSIHLLHVLPASTAQISRTCLQHLEIIKPQLSGTNINTDLIQDKLVSLSDDLSVLA